MLNQRKQLFLGVTRIQSMFADTLGNERTGLGTGFWMRLASGKDVLITNRHNVDPSIKFPDNPDFKLHSLKIELRRISASGDNRPTISPETQFFEISDNSQLFASANADCAICVANFKNPNEDFPVTAPFEESDLADDDFFLKELRPAHELYFIGFAGRRSDQTANRPAQSWWDTKWNFPVARSAVVASMPFLTFRNETIKWDDVLLVSGMSFSGSSGSPVISREIGFRSTPPSAPGSIKIKFEGYAPEKLIGIMTGHWQSKHDTDDAFEHSGLSYITRSTSIIHLIKHNAL